MNNISCKVLFNFIACTALLYFTLHSIYGARGIMGYIRTKNELQKVKNILQSVQSERVKIEHKVSLFHPDSLDLDILEEEAKKGLGLVKKEEKIIHKDILFLQR